VLAVIGFVVGRTGGAFWRKPSRWLGPQSTFKLGQLSAKAKEAETVGEAELDTDAGTL